MTIQNADRKHCQFHIFLQVLHPNSRGVAPEWKYRMDSVSVTPPTPFQRKKNPMRLKTVLSAYHSPRGGKKGKGNRWWRWCCWSRWCLMAALWWRNLRRATSDASASVRAATVRSSGGTTGSFKVAAARMSRSISMHQVLGSISCDMAVTRGCFMWSVGNQWGLAWWHNYILMSSTTPLGWGQCLLQLKRTNHKKLQVVPLKRVL